jgi:hypothetical protein
MIMFFFCSQLLLKCPAGSAQPCSSMASAGGPASAAAAAPAAPAAPTGNKKRRLSGAKKDSLKLQLATQEEERLAKEKLERRQRYHNSGAKLPQAVSRRMLQKKAFQDSVCKERVKSVRVVDTRSYLIIAYGVAPRGRNLQRCLVIQRYRFRIYVDLRIA